jgi:hypothetical protein
MNCTFRFQQRRQHALKILARPMETRLHRRQSRVSRASNFFERHFFVLRQRRLGPPSSVWVGLRVRPGTIGGCPTLNIYELLSLIFFFSETAKLPKTSFDLVLETSALLAYEPIHLVPVLDFTLSSNDFAARYFTGLFCPYWQSVPNSSLGWWRPVRERYGIFDREAPWEKAKSYRWVFLSSLFSR